MAPSPVNLQSQCTPHTATIQYNAWNYWPVYVSESVSSELNARHCWLLRLGYISRPTRLPGTAGVNRRLSYKRGRHRAEPTSPQCVHQSIYRDAPCLRSPINSSVVMVRACATVIGYFITNMTDFIKICSKMFAYSYSTSDTFGHLILIWGTHQKPT